MENVVFNGSRRLPAGLALTLAAVISLSISPLSGPAASASTDKPIVKKTGITVTGGFNTTPKMTFPDGAAPRQLTEDTLIAGTGTKVRSGDTVITNYVGEIWPKKAGSKPKVFDSSYSRGAPTGFAIRAGAVIPGFYKTLVGKRVGTRELMTIPPADGYGSSGNAQAGISGTDTLVFVVDLLADYKPSASAPGTVDDKLPATGWPKIVNPPGRPPAIASVAGVKAPTNPTSRLLVKGKGHKIDPSKTLVLQLVEADISTGKHTQSSWGKQPQLIKAQDVLSVVTALKGQSVGARAVTLLPATPAQPATSTNAAQPATPSQVLIIDVVGQY